MFKLTLSASFESTMLWVYVHNFHFQCVFTRQNLLSIEGLRAGRVEHINVKFVNHQMMSEDTDLFCINYVDISSSLMCDLSNNRYWAFDVLRGSTDAIIFQKSNKLKFYICDDIYVEIKILKSNFQSSEFVDRVSETQLQMTENFNLIVTSVLHIFLS